MSKSLPKILRHDAVLFQLGTKVRRLRKDRDQWEVLTEPADADITLYYMDMRPTNI